MRDCQSLANAIHEWSIQIFESQHHTTLSSPSGPALETFHKVGFRFIITCFVEDIIRHDLNDTKSNIPGKLNRLAKDIPPLLAEFRGVTAEWIFAMPTQAHRHDFHAAVGNRTT